MSSYGYSSGNDNGTVIVIIIVIGLAILGFGALKCSANVSGESKETATQEAKVFVKDVSPGALVTCSGGDSDGDGYVSCTVVPQGDKAGQPFSIQCAAAYSLQSDGCKLTPAITNPQGIQ